MAGLDLGGRQEDLDTLAGAAFEAAEELLAKRGEFQPFAITLDLDGAPSLVAGHLGAPSSQAVLETLYDGVAQERETRRAVAFVSLVGVDGGDAVRVEIEHRDGGPASAVFLPYARKRLRRSFTFGELHAEAAERRIWAAG